MSIRSIALISGIVFSAMLAALLFMVVQAREISIERIEKERHRSSAKELVLELLLSVEALSRIGRSYVVTEDPVYKKYFDQILIIRNGNIISPSGYFLMYWYSKGIGMLPEHKQDKALPHTDLLRGEGLTATERELLREARVVSDQLVAVERRAVVAFDGLFVSGLDKNAVPGESGKEMTIALLLSEAIRQPKTQSIEQFVAVLDAQVRDEIETEQSKLETLSG